MQTLETDEFQLPKYIAWVVIFPGSQVVTWCGSLGAQNDELGLLAANCDLVPCAVVCVTLCTVKLLCVINGVFLYKLVSTKIRHTKIGVYSSNCTLYTDTWLMLPWLVHGKESRICCVGFCQHAVAVVTPVWVCLPLQLTLGSVVW
jgi:hypothetical protein